ncbi:MAG: nucleotidyltransferase domain-containing protein [Faecalimonas sp.]|nr:nucleotidyltransferase domain-containing protein [Faecalimonas sp.]
MKNSGLNETITESIISIAKQHGVEKVLLFGSRARGDFRKTSDIDIAVSGGDIARFVADIHEETPTLLMFDIVNLDGSVQKELMQSIEQEGITIYEKV